MFPRVSETFHMDFVDDRLSCVHAKITITTADVDSWMTFSVLQSLLHNVLHLKQHEIVSQVVKKLGKRSESPPTFSGSFYRIAGSTFMFLRSQIRSCSLSVCATVITRESCSSQTTMIMHMWREEKKISRKKEQKKIVTRWNPHSDVMLLFYCEENTNKNLECVVSRAVGKCFLSRSLNLVALGSRSRRRVSIAYSEKIDSVKSWCSWV